MKLNRIAIGGVAGMMGLGLIGVGAHAAFTTTTTSSQQVTAGTLKVVFSTNGGKPGTGTTSLTLPNVGPTGSSFVASTQVTVKNEGNIPANERLVAVTASTSGTATKSTALEDQMWACLTFITTNGTVILFNEPLSTAIGYGPISVLGTLAPAATTKYTLTLYAGSTDAGCGAPYTHIGPYPGFPGNSFLPAKPFHYRGTKNTTKNTSDSTGLNNTAEGGIVKPSMTIHFTA